MFGKTFGPQPLARTTVEVARLPKDSLVEIDAVALEWTKSRSSRKGHATDKHSQEKLSLGDADVKQLLLIMDTGKNAKISKQEWMTFMEAEFDRLDKAKNGQLDVKELAQSQLRVSHFSSVGK